jgi:hypothetical protein
MGNVCVKVPRKLTAEVGRLFYVRTLYVGYCNIICMVLMAGLQKFDLYT